MKILSLSEIPALKEAIKQYGYTIHVHDACGGQAFSLEAIGDIQNNKVFDMLEEFFTSQKMSLTFFGNDKLNFVAR